jgi:hypothetical protein
MRCESEGGFEDCVNCPLDCGECALRACGESITCVIGCLDFGGGGMPGFDFNCTIGCVSQTCPDSRSYLNNVINCFAGAFFSGECMDISCAMSMCSGELAACLADRGC